MGLKLKWVAIIVLILSISGFQISGEENLSENGKRIITIWNEITPYAVPLPPELILKIDKKSDDIEAVHSYEGFRHTITVSEGISKLTDDEIRTILAHELGHVVLKKYTKKRSGIEAYQEEFEAHLHGAEMYARMGTDAGIYIKNLRNIFNTYGKMTSADPLKKIPDALSERVQYINTMPLVYQIIENRILNSDFSEAKKILNQAHKNLGYTNIPPFDEHLFAVINYLSLKTSAEDWQKVKDMVEDYKEYYNGHLLLSRSLIIPSKPIKGRFRSSSSMVKDERPQALTDALENYKNAIQTAPYWLEARINYLYAADLSVNIYRNGNEKEFAMQNAVEIEKSLDSLDPKIKAEAFNTLAVWYAGLALENPKMYSKAMDFLTKAEKSVGCINKDAPNAWQICYNGNILAQTSKIKTTVFNKEKSENAIASSQSAERLAFDLKRNNLRIKIPVVPKGAVLPDGVSQELRGFFGNSNKKIEEVEKYLKDNPPKEGLTVLENSGAVIYRDAYDNISIAFSVEVDKKTAPLIEKEMKSGEPTVPFVFPEKKEKPKLKIKKNTYSYSEYGINSAGIYIEFSLGR